MALVNRISMIDKAVLTATGNSLVVCGSTTDKEANTSDMLTVDGNVTRSWMQNGSSANVNILSGSKILYAELIWYSTVKSNNSSAPNLISSQDSAINFTTSKGTNQITPKYTDTFTGDSGNIDRFRAADVTSIVAASLSGKYTVSAVPVSIPPSGSSNTRAGWTLVVIYKNETVKPSFINFMSGIANINGEISFQTSVTGFYTSNSDFSLKGRMLAICANGGPLTGNNENLKIGSSFMVLNNQGNIIGTPNTNPGTAPNNPHNNFFAGQINVCDPLNDNIGIIDVSGTNGSNNHDAFVPSQIIGARNKWDMTCIDISKELIQNQNQIAVQINTDNSTKDGIEMLAIGSQVCTQAPDITVSFNCFDVDGDYINSVEVGEKLVYTIHIVNNGDVVADNLTINCNLIKALSYISNSFKLNGVMQQNVDLANGVNIGSVGAKGVANVVFIVNVNSLPTGKVIIPSIGYSYQFRPGANAPVYTNSDQITLNDIIVYSAELNIQESVSKSSVIRGEMIDYTVSVKNSGTIDLSDIIFQNMISQYCSFVTGSVYVDGVQNSQLNPNYGFMLQDITVNQSRIVKFTVKINQLSPSAAIDNNSIVTYSYQYGEYNYAQTKTVNSNKTSVIIQYSDIIGNRVSSNDYPKVSDIVSYALTLTNIGNVDALNVSVAEPSITGAAFVSGSVTVNGSKKSSLNPFIGFTIDSIGAKQTATITYDVSINEIPPDEIVVNIAKVPFKYQIQPGGNVITDEKDSNKVTTKANFVKLTIPEQVDKQYAAVGDYLNYSIDLTNAGNINAFNTMFLSNIQTDAQFVTGSVKINGLSYPDFDPNTGFSVGVIAPGDTINVSFVVKVLQVPKSKIVYNNSELVYSSKPDPNGAAVVDTIISNTVHTIINEMKFSIVKSANKQYAQVGDSIVYTVVIENIGTVTLKNAVFGDKISSYSKFRKETVYINSVNYTDYDPNNSFNIGDINPGDRVTVIFAVDINSLPSSGYITNYANMLYGYRLNPDTAYIYDTVNSNDVYVNVVSASLSVTKECNKQYAKIGDVLTYSFAVSNIGNITVTDTRFIDNLPTAVAFVPRSVKINEIVKSGYNPSTGFSLGSLAASQVYKISFTVSVNSLPVPNTVINSAAVLYDYYVNPNDQLISNSSKSNTTTTIINAASVTVQKYVDKAYATIGDILSYSILIQNTGTVDLTDIVLTDLIQSEATLVKDSVKINGVTNNGYDPNSGFSILDITVNGAELIEFKVKVNSLPNPNTIVNSAGITYKYLIDPSGTVKSSGSANSNSVTTTINNAVVSNTKTVSKSYATNGDLLTYTSVIKNSGNIAITDTKFTDIVPNYAVFAAGSVKINGNTQASFDPNLGFTLGTIAQGASVTVSFDVNINVPVNLISNVLYIINTSNLNYKYNIDPNIAAQIADARSNDVKTNINTSGMNVLKTADRDYARINDVVNYTLIVTNTGNIALSSIDFKDIIQTEASLIVNSVYINDVQKNGFDPSVGFLLDDIGVGQYSVIKFSVTVNAIPASAKLVNKGVVNYSYYIDPNQPKLKGTADSNETTVNIKDTIISAEKEVDKSIAKIGDTLTFSFVINNKGNNTAQNIVFKDILDSNLKFVDKSVVINSVGYTSVDPNTGFTLDDIAANGHTEVSFKATVMTRPADNIVKNYADVKYSFIVGPDTKYGEMTTNITETYIAAGELTVTKYVNKKYATVSDTLTYTVNVRNTGSVDATDLSFKDLIPASAIFNPGTVKINNVLYNSFNPNSGFNIPDLSLNEVNVISFDVSVNSVPDSGEIDNTAKLTFKYKLMPADTKQEDGTAVSNTVITYVNLGSLMITKSVDKVYATLLDVLNYTISIKNVGNTKCSNLVFTDILQAEAVFVEKSVYIDNQAYQGYNPNSGFSVKDLNPGQSVTIKFAATVNAIPSTLNVYNSSSVSYNYYVDQSKVPVAVNKNSNLVDTIINFARVNVTKTVSKQFATIGDMLTYTVEVFNFGTVNITNVNFRDLIPDGTTFVKDSVTIDGSNIKGYDPYQSFTLGTIIAGESKIVSFNVQVTSLPTQALITNTANVIFSYKIDPTGEYSISEADSNTVTTQINVGSISVTKAVDKYYTVSGSIITYSFVVKNTGNVDAVNVLFLDNLQEEVTFNTDSVKINGVTKNGFDPTEGFSLGTIPTLATVNISFSVTVNNNPSKYVIVNFAQGIFSYYIDPSAQPLTTTVQSNAVTSVIVIGLMTASKVVDMSYATVGDTLSYKIIVKNIGNIVLNNVAFIDNLSDGAQFKSGSVIVNGTAQSKYNPITGFTLPDITAGDTCIIEFKVKVTSVPNPAQVTNYSTINATYKIDPLGADNQIAKDTNTVSTQINVGVISDVKAVDKDYAQVGEVITYTNTLTNIGNVISEDVWFFDDIVDKAAFVPGSVSINGVVNPLLNPQNGFSLGNILPKKFIVVEFSVKITGLPTASELDNMSQTQFSYRVDPNGLLITNSVFSNIVKTNVVKGELTAVKSVDKTIATLNDTLNYTIAITNTGNTIANNIFFQDTPSTGATFVKGSVEIDGVSQAAYDPTNGFTINFVGVGNTAVVTFSALVTSVPATNEVTNQAVLNYKYLVDPKQPAYAQTTYSNITITNIALGKLSVVKTVDKDFATIDEILTYTIVIKNIGNINASNITFIDATPKNSVFVVNSVYVNGVNKPGLNPAVGFDLNVMKPGEIITVVYQVKVVI